MTMNIIPIGIELTADPYTPKNNNVSSYQKYFLYDCRAVYHSICHRGSPFMFVSSQTP